MAGLQLDITNNTSEPYPKPTGDTPVMHYTTRWAKGKLIATGVSGIVELLSTGQVTKSPWPEDEESRQDVATEALAYQRLFDRFGAHERFIKQISYDESENTITMEHMKNGTLRAYLEAHKNRISYGQRILWVCALAQGMEMLHTANIMHCDFSPRNMLLDTTLELKVTDFGCVSIDGARSSAGGSARFYIPRVLSRERFEVDDDLFALGSSIFEVLTGEPPYADLSIDQVRTLYGVKQFPYLSGLDLGDIIRDCWLLRAKSACDVHQRLLGISSGRVEAASRAREKVYL
jgi:serine/threonine protein kinase